MSYLSDKGRAYTSMDLERLASIEAFGQYTGAIKGLLQRVRMLEKENGELKQVSLAAESYKQQLLQLRAEVNSLKK